MHTKDFLAALGVVIVATASAYFKIYYLTIGASLFFFLLITNMVVFYVSMPMPRYMLGMGIPKEQLAELLTEVNDQINKESEAEHHDE